MPLRNRVTPFGDIVAVAERGTLYGNRGCLHDKSGQIVRWANGRRWITCVLDLKGRRRPLVRPGRYTELFFLDEATSFAAGHRPCAECRRDDYNRFRDAWATATGAAGRLSANDLDAALDAERRDGNARRTFMAKVVDLPDGAFVDLDGGAHLVLSGTLLAWSSSGYAAAVPAPAQALTVVTPATVVEAISAGYEPALNPSAKSAAQRS